MRNPLTQKLFLPTILAATFMGQFDFFVSNVAAPSIQRDLGASEGQIELVIAAYALTYAAGLITGGRLGDLGDRKKVFLIGLVAFSIASVLCGVAPTVWLLIGARLLQGLAAAVMLPQVLAFINTVLPDDARATAIGWFAVAGGVGSIAGQGLGGILLSASPLGLGWRIIFLINIPIMLLAIVAAILVIPATSTGTRGSTSIKEANSSERGLDIPGALGLFAGMALLVGAITMAQNGWFIAAVAAAIVGALALFATLRYEMLQARRGQPVTINPEIFTVASMRTGSMAMGAFVLYFASFMFVLTLVLQEGGALSPAAAGLVFVPSGVTFMVSSMISPRLGWSVRKRILTGTAVTAFGLTIGLLAAILGYSGVPLAWWLVVVVTFTGLGNGFILPTILQLATSDIPPQQAGMAGGAVFTIQQFGSAVGVAVMGWIYFSVAAVSVPAALGTILAVFLALLGALALIAGFASAGIGAKERHN